MTDEQKEKAIKIVRDHYATIDFLTVEGYPIEDKANRMAADLFTIYRKLEAEQLLPDGTDWLKFQTITIALLEYAANMAILSQRFA